MSSHNFFKLKTKNYKSCFVYLKPRKGFESGSPVQVVGDVDVYYFSVVFTEGLDQDSIGISSLYAKTLGFTEGQSVVVSPIQPLPVVNRITIRPYKQADYEVLELLAQNVQSNLLDQVRVVRTGQKLCIWLGNNLFVTVMVETVQPITLGTLDFLTEVVINTPSDNQLQTTPEGKQTSQRSEVDKALTVIKSWKNTFDNPSLTKQLDKFVQPLKFSLRLVPLSKLPNPPCCVHQFTVFASQNSLNDLQFVLQEPFYQMSLLDQTSDKTVYVKLKLLNSQNCNEIFVHDSVFNYFKAHIGARVILQKVLTKPLVEHILIEGKGQDLVTKVKQYLADNCTEPFILNGKFPLMLADQSLFSLDFGSSKFCIVEQGLLRKCSYSSTNALISLIDESEGLKKYDDSGEWCLEVQSIEKVGQDILKALLKGGVFNGGNIVLTGNLGTGKTSLLRHIASTLRSYPYFLHTETVKCKSLKGKTVESLQKFFSDIFSTLILAQPSLLVLDDLYVICEANEGEDNPNSIHHSRVSEMLYRLFKVVQEVHCVGILASTVAISKLNSRIYRSRGRYLFDHVFSIQDLNKEGRVSLLKHYFKTPEIDYDALALKTDGFVVQDLENLYLKALFEAYKGCGNQHPVINNEHCIEALKKSCALSLQNVQFHLPGDKSFSEIGGLQSIKSILMESLLWPLKYANIFANSPLRLQSGILLYGPPGTGKTVLACAAAKQCSLRLISVKGPELLSKYIGASEQAVRDIFEKAQRAKPCILFFDEFDSLAPRRGHDNTGVTDRVVNQLLTQLDGVESLKGVCVLAATSRPDLLDPALLRPGRLDKQLFCPMPSKDDRLEILQIMSRKLNLGDNVDLEIVASKTDGYTGADLHSVLCTAQLSTMKNILQKETVTVEQSQIDQTCLLDALNQTRPSLTKREKEKYDIIYKKFRGGQLDDFKTGSKVTLA